MTLVINRKKVQCEMEPEGNRRVFGSYDALTLGPGKHEATIEGPMEINGDFIRLDDGSYAMRDVIEFARRGERGLKVVA